MNNNNNNKACVYTICMRTSCAVHYDSVTTDVNIITASNANFQIHFHSKVREMS